MVRPDGFILARHRKINTHAEPWAALGKRAQTTDWNGLVVGILICAEVYTCDIAEDLRGHRAKLLVSLAAWGPALNGPEGEWEQPTRETGLLVGAICRRGGHAQSRDEVRKGGYSRECGCTRSSRNADA